jgi:hypothetical protein
MKTSVKTKTNAGKVIPVSKAAVVKNTEPRYEIHKDDYDENVTGSVTVKNSTFGFQFETSDVPHCCGMSELGAFYIRGNSTTITRPTKVELVKRMLDRIIEENTSGRTCRTLFFTTINNEACNLVDEAVAAGAPFTLVKTFVNSNSSSTNRLYVSNN